MGAAPQVTPAQPAQMTNGKALVGLIGSGIGQSLTPAMQEEEALHHGLRLHYQLIDLDRSSSGAQALPGLLQAARTMGFAGLNITYPCKQAVIPLLDELSEEARAMAAVNTVVLREGRLIGHNTDGSGWAWGFKRSLPNADLSRVVLLGTGGAGSAIAHAALRLGVKHLRLFDREPERAQVLADELNAIHGAAHGSSLGFSLGTTIDVTAGAARVVACTEIAQALDGATGLIHATPIGMAKLPGIALPAALLHAGLWVSEVVYFPLETALLKAARAAGCAVADGGGMAVGQAIGAFELFTGRQANPERVCAHFARLLQARQAAG